jgi:hypothetical protein
VNTTLKITQNSGKQIGADTIVRCAHSCKELD